MKTITLLITNGGEGIPPVQVLPSDGIQPADGLRACRYGVRVFEAQMMEAQIDAEVQRRLAEMAEQDGGEDDA